MAKQRITRQQALVGALDCAGAATLRSTLAVTGAVTLTDPLTHANLEPQVERYVDVTISAAEMLALSATPKQLVAAPGAGYALIFTGALLFLDYNAAAYAGIAAGEDLAVKYTDGSGLQVGSCEATGFLDLTADAFRWVRPYHAASGVSDIVPVANAALVMQMLVGEVTTGDSPVKVRTFYRRVPTSF